MNMVAAFVLLALYLGFGAITNENGILPMVEEYIAEEHSKDSEKMKNYFRWMCSILWIIFWPLFLIWGLSASFSISTSDIKKKENHDTDN